MTTFGDLVLRVASARAQRGELDASWLDASGLLLGLSGLRRLVQALHAGQALPGELAALAEADRASEGPRRLAALVGGLSDRELSRSNAVQLERARLHLELLAGLSPGRSQDVAEEVDQVVEDLVLGRELL